LFSQQGIIRITRNNKGFNSIPWDCTTNMYYYKGCIGPLYAIFSTVELDKKYQKRLIRLDSHLFPHKTKDIFIFPLYTEGSRKNLDNIFNKYRKDQPYQGTADDTTESI
jgi:hypothetical protein